MTTIHYWNRSVALESTHSLVKFCTAEVALNILNSQALRWSAPHLYNDPFEPSHKSTPDLSPEALLKGLTKEAIMMLFGPSEPAGKSNRLIAAIARWREEERFASEEEAEQVLNQLLSQVAQQQQASIDSFLASWQHFASTLRICSFSDKPGNMACWQRYADNHSGIALRFSAGDDTALKDPKRVTYSTKPSEITSLSQQVNIVYGRETAPDTDNFIDKMLSKNKDNSNEREWRCFGSEIHTNTDDEQSWFSAKPFATGELKAVYFGLNTPEPIKAKVTELIHKQYRSTKLYQATPLTGQYAIDFTAL